MPRLICLLAVCLVSLSSASQSTYIVDTDEEGISPTNGTMTLRMAVNAVNSGAGAIADTILIQVTGTYMPTSVLDIQRPCYISGPAPSRFQIDGSNMGSEPVLITSTSAPPVQFRMIGFQNGAAGVVRIANNAQVDFERCAFRDNQTAGSGGAVECYGDVSFLACSFTNNQSNGVGGAVYIDPGATMFGENLSFQDNKSVFADGGAIHTSGSTILDFCTFYQDSAMNGNGGGIYVGGGGMNISNCLFHRNGDASVVGKNVYENLVSLVLSGGGSLMLDGENTLSMINGIDQIGGGYTIGLRPNGYLTDGFGLDWIPITNPLSSAIGGRGFPGLQEDIRRAPRILASPSSNQADCGAVEYTEFRVTSNAASGPNTLDQAVNMINSNPYASPYFVSFDMPPGTTTIQNTSAYDFNTFANSVFVDGFTQPGSMVPGPTDNVIPGVPGIMPVVLDGQGTAGAGIRVTSVGPSDFCGLTITDYGEGMFITSSDVHAYGNYFGLSDFGADPGTFALDATGIHIDASDGCLIGGFQDWERNCFGRLNQTTNAHVHLNTNSADNHIIAGNYIGTTGDGQVKAGVTQPDGVWVESGVDIVIANNLISGNHNGVYATGLATEVAVLSNYIGVDAHGLAAIPNVATGVLIQGTGGNNCLVHSNLISGNNTGGSTAGVVFDGCNAGTIQSNWIGLAADGITALGNDVGIWLDGCNGIGIGGPALIDGNRISANGLVGIHLNNSTASTLIEWNILGLDTGGVATVPLENGTGMIISSNSVANNIGTPTGPNFVCNSNQDGIVIDNAHSNFLYGNFIGATPIGTFAGNGANGIYLVNGASGNQMGGLNPGEPMFIASNGGHGVEMTSGAVGNQLSGDTIANNVGDGVRIDGVTTTSNIVFDCPIFDNGGLGIDLQNGSNNDVPTPSLAGVTICNGTPTVVVTVPSGSTTNYDFQFFRIPSGGEDPSGFGEGNEIYHTDPNVSVGPTPWTQTFSLPAGLLVGDLVTLTITDVVTGVTSEFSNWAGVVPKHTIALDSTVDVSCAGGSDGGAWITVTDGVPGFTYNWLTSINASIGTTEDMPSGLPMDTYSVIVTDSVGCEDTLAGIVINEPPALTGSATVTSNFNGAQLSCVGASDGEITTTVSGGTSPFDISYDGAGSFPVLGTGANHAQGGFAAGSYEVVIRDANGCIYNAGMVNISPPPTLTADASGSSNVSCHGLADGVLSGVATGGVGGYTYTWTPGPMSGQVISNVPPGTYSLTVVDNNGCTANDSYVVTEPTEVVAVIDSFHNVTCNGDADGEIYTTTSGGVPGYIYQWTDSGGPAGSSDDLTGLGPDTYTFIATDATGCADTITQIITEPGTLTGSATVTSNYNGSEVSCVGSTDGEITTVISGGTGPYNISFNNGSSYPAMGVGSGHMESGFGAGVYTIIVQDQNGCSYNAGNVAVNDPPALSVTASGSDATCFGFNDGTASAVGSGGSGTLNYTWNPGSMIGATQTNLAPNTYSVTVMDANSCTAVDVITISEPPVLAISVDSFLDAQCFGDSGSIFITVVGGNGSPYNYVWSNSVPTNVHFGEDLVDYPADTYQVIAQDGLGCADTVTQVISEPPQLLPGTITTTDPSCFGGSDGQVDLGMPSGGTPSYQFSDGGTPQGSSIFTGLAAGTYSGYMTVDANGCITTYPSFTINNPPPITVDAGIGPSICAGSSTNLNGMVTVATGGQWSNGGGTYAPNDMDLNAVYTPSAAEVTAGSATLYLTSTGNGGCAAVQDTLVINIAAAPVADAGLPDTICVGSTVTLSGAVVNSVGGTWNSSGDGSFNNPSSMNPIYTPGPGDNATGAVTLYLMTNTISVCPDDLDSVEIIISSPPNAGSDSTVALCNDAATIDLMPLVGAGDPGGSWVDPAATGALSGSIFDPMAVSPGVPTNYTFYYVVQGLPCPPDTATVTVLVNPLPNIDVPGSTVLDASCEGVSNGMIVVAATGVGTSFMYSIDGGSNFQASDTFPGLPDSTYTITVQDINTGCINSENFTVGNSYVLMQSITYSDPLCADSLGMIQVDISGGTMPYYISSVGVAGPFIPLGVGQSTFTTNNAIAGQYWIVSQDSVGCLSEVDTITLVEPPPITYDVSVIDICPPIDGSIEFLNAMGGTGSSYQFSIDGGANWSSLSFFSGLDTAGVYQVSVADINGCIVDTTAVVNSSQPTPPVITVNNPYCDGTGTISATGTGIINWFDLTNTYGTGTTINLPPNLNNGDSIYAVNEVGGCESQAVAAMLIIVDNDMVVVGDSVVCPDDSITLWATGSGTFAWLQDGTIDDTSRAVVNVLPFIDHYYYVTMTLNGCSFTDSIFIDVDTDDPDCGFEIANAFSPNGDGTNDIWYIQAVEDYPNNNVYIVNRWGDEIRHIENYDNMVNFWDGTDGKGGTYPAGTYFYVIEFTDLERIEKGWVQITRD